MRTLIEAFDTFLEDEGRPFGVIQTPIADLRILHFGSPTAPQPIFYRPALCVPVQGVKQAVFGSQTVVYRPMQALVVGVDTPASSRVLPCGDKLPFIGLALDLDIAVFREVALQLSPRTEVAQPEAGYGFFVTDVSTEVADCLARLVRLARLPQAASLLYRPLTQELAYWLLTARCGARLLQYIQPAAVGGRLAKPLALLREQYNAQIPVQEMAEAARMSVSSFHHHFKRATSMSPLQYRKEIRLLEAKRMMNEGALTVEQVALRVGYESVSQFHRDYRRRFGSTPRQADGSAAARKRRT